MSLIRIKLIEMTIQLYSIYDKKNANSVFFTPTEYYMSTLHLQSALNTRLTLLNRRFYFSASVLL